MGVFDLQVENSEVDIFRESDFTGVISFADCIVGNWWDTVNTPPAVNNFLISGTVTFLNADLSQSSMGDQWFNTVVRRTFPCRVLANNPSSATIKVLRPDGNTVFSGHPNREGYLTTSQITFDPTNYNKPWTIRLMYNSQVLAEKELRISTSTPIQLSTEFPLPKRMTSTPEALLLLLNE